MFRARPVRLKRQSINKLIPNMLTLMALCAGLSSIRFALLERWEWAVAAIILAAFLDNLDGRMARLLNAGTQFGVELDSLSDFLSFGIAPAVVVYLWSLQDVGGFGWTIVLFYSVCCALRLARFNAGQGEVLPPWGYNYFTGVSAPAGAGLVLLPMMLTFETGLEIFRLPAVAGAVIICTAVLLISSIPTYSLKRIKIPQKYVLLTLLGVGLVGAMLVSEFWATFIGIVVVYFASLPFSIRSFTYLKREAERIKGQTGDDTSS
ncbi:MAG: phosphatidylcholine/phosphatidylserine synthase [Rhodospirillaceae bacterium]|jgi:CDP-diacylglycerol---serine O-phosphatidyltransferase|nr:phosphatidylcholine/phosphatidylserine synthase [Rhodospirillaceae bacterium]MBT5658632.1 phosphatidylcholine/phosphatidylserine synthase [Rhodospirillaceae bacterium]MBT5751877.1 phosphatidylcholine/phosphatidylserine synthase [Rhodospirillaceae bacterium]